MAHVDQVVIHGYCGIFLSDPNSKAKHQSQVPNRWSSSGRITYLRLGGPSCRVPLTFPAPIAVNPPGNDRRTHNLRMPDASNTAHSFGECFGVWLPNITPGLDILFGPVHLPLLLHYFCDSIISNVFETIPRRFKAGWFKSFYLSNRFRVTPNTSKHQGSKPSV